MPIYELEDPATGRTITVEGDSPPTQEDAQQLFALPVQEDDSLSGMFGDDYSENAERLGKIGQGITFGFGDEITSGIEALIDSATSDKTFNESYRQAHTRKQRDRERFEDENPYEAMALEVAGGLATGGLGAGRALASQAIRNAPRLVRGGAMSGLGAAEGALYGAGTADQGERLQGAGEGAAIGAVAAPVVAAGTNVLGRLFGSVGDRAARLAESSPERDALRVIRDMADAGEVSADDVVRRMDELGPQATLADTADVFTQTARASMNRPGRTREDAVNLVDERNRGQRQRMLQGVREDVAQDPTKSVQEQQKRLQELTEGKQQSFLSAQDDIVTRRKEQAAPIYAEAQAQGVEITPMLKPLLSNANVLKYANNILRAEGKPILKRPPVENMKAGATAFDNMTPQRRYEVLKAAKEGLDDAVSANFRSGNNNVAAKLLETKNNLLGALIAQNPAYGKANRIYADESAMENALKLGRGFLQDKYEPAELQRMLRNMTDGEREVFQVGAIDAISQKMNKSAAADKTRVFRNRSDYQDKVRLVLGDQTDSFLKRLDVEEQFERTRQGVTGNSTTMMQKQFDDALQESIDPGLIRELGDLNPGNVIGKVIGVLSRRGPSAETMNQVGSILMKQGYTEKQIRNILAGNPVRRALGSEYDDVIAPYAQGLGITATAPLTINND